VFRVAISNSRIINLDNRRVTFKYKDSAADQVKFATVSPEEFIRRFLQHVLPQGFVKVRYYGLLSPANRHLLDNARHLLITRSKQLDSKQSQNDASPAAMRCPFCGSQMSLATTFKAKGRSPPS
jgi:hypothetical protein